MKALHRIAAALTAGTLLLAGCVTRPKPGDDPAYHAARPLPQPAAVAGSGSLYPAGYGTSLYQSGPGLSLFETMVARRVGDILTINLVERTDAKKKAETGVTKDSSSSSGISVGTSGLATQPWNANLDTSSSRDAEGTGESEQSNSLKGSISVVVSEVLPNGNLLVRGEKWIALNQGDEYIRITGLVRPQDISPNNTVPSYLVADARISYGGTGPIADANTLGWITRFFISAVFPF